MTEEAKKICKLAHNVLRVTCDQVVAGSITLNDLKFIGKEKRRIQRLCTEAAIGEFNLEKWLSKLDAIVEYIGKVQEYHNLLTSEVQGT